MVRKYYQDKKDRMDERRGMERRERKHDLDDGYMDMIHSDYSAPSNLPQDVVHKYYPKNDYMDMHYLDDTYKGIDDTIDDSVRKTERHSSDSMY